MHLHIAIFVIEKLEVVSIQLLNTHVKCKKQSIFDTDIDLWQHDNDVALTFKYETY